VIFVLARNLAKLTPCVTLFVVPYLVAFYDNYNQGSVKSTVGSDAVVKISGCRSSEKKGWWMHDAKGMIWRLAPSQLWKFVSLQ